MPPTRADIFPAPARLRVDERPGHIVSSGASASVTLTARSAGRAVRWCRRRCAGNARPAPRRSAPTAAAMPSPGRPVLHRRDQRRHRVAPALRARPCAWIASSATISARCSSSDEIEQHAGRAPRCASRRRPGTIGARARRTRRALVARRGQRDPQRAPREQQADAAGTRPPRSTSATAMQRARRRRLGPATATSAHDSHPAGPGTPRAAPARAASPAPPSAARRRDRRPTAARRS